jgi:hypothetical protein
VIDSASGSVVARYDAPLGSFADSSAVILASGFLTPSANNNGPAFGLWVAFPGGGNLIPLTNVTGINNISNSLGIKFYPNPTSGILNISFGSAIEPQVSILDLNGNVVKSLTNTGASSISANVSDLSDGMYILHMVTANGTANEKFTLIR